MGGADDITLAMLTVKIREARYALPVAQVEGVVTVPVCQIGVVPSDTSGRVRGIFNYRGSPVAIARVRGLETYAQDRGEENLTLVIVRNGEDRFALPVDQAQAVTQADGDIARMSGRALYAGEIYDRA